MRALLTRIPGLAFAGSVLAVAAACDYDGSFLFADVEDVDSIVHLTCEGAPNLEICPSGADPKFFTPVVIDNNPPPGQEVNGPELVAANTVYAEVGATGSSQLGGVTFNFQGTGRDVCVWMDPEVAFWNQAVAADAAGAAENYTYPDNVYDDGDLDLFIGQSVFYTGSEGDQIGDFNVSYTDSLGNQVQIELTACAVPGWNGFVPDAHGGRASPEFCTVRNTDVGISYTALFRTYATPLDDDRLGFGFFVYDGSCADLQDITGAASIPRQECLLRGESIDPGKSGKDQGPWFGTKAIKDLTWDGFDEMEDAFCAGTVADYCKDEAKKKAKDGEVCTWQEVTKPENRCFCGDPRDTPSGGAN